MRAGATVGFAWDGSAGSMLVAVDGGEWKTLFAEGLLPSKEVGAGLFPALSGYNGVKVSWNFGHKPWLYGPPSSDYTSALNQWKLLAGYSEMLSQLGISVEGLMEAFNNMEAEHRGLDFESFNDDDTYKHRLNETLDCKVGLGKMQQAIYNLLEQLRPRGRLNGATVDQARLVTSGELLDFHEWKEDLAEQCGEGYTWRTVLAGVAWFRFIEHPVVPLDCPPCQAAVVLTCILDKNSSVKKLTLDATCQPDLDKLLPTLRLQDSSLQVAKYMPVVVGLLLASAQMFQVAELQSGGASRAMNILTEADLQTAQYTAEGLKMLEDAVLVGSRGRGLVRVNGLSLHGGDTLNLKQRVKRNNAMLGSLGSELKMPGDWNFVGNLLALQECRRLDLSDNSLGSVGTTKLSISLRNLTLLQHLSIGFNSIGSAAARKLSTALANLTLLESLDLRFNSLGPEGASALSPALANMTLLQYLDVRNNKILAKGWLAIMDGLAPVTSLTSLNGFDVAGLCGGGAEECNLNGKEEGLAAAVSRWMPRSASSLTLLNLSGKRMYAEGATALSGPLGILTRLVTLDMRNNSVSARGAANLSSALANLTLLQSLNLGSNDLGSEGATALSGPLRRLTGLVMLDMRNNALFAEGADVLSPALSTLTLLQILSLGRNNLGARGWRVVMDALNLTTSLTSLNGFDGVLSLRKGGLTALHANGQRLLEQGLAEMLSRWLPRSDSSLTLLNLSNNLLGNESASVLSTVLVTLSRLKNLDIGGNALGSEGAAKLSPALGSLTLLRQLNLSNNLIGDAGATVLSTTLASMTHLEGLNLRGNEIGAEGVEALGGLTKLTTLDVGNNLGAQGWRAAMEALNLTTSLTSLNGFDGVLSLRKGGLTALHANGQRLLEQGLAEMLSRWLPRSDSSLTLLNLSGNALRPEDAAKLSPVLGYLTLLQQLYLGENSLGAEGAGILSPALATLTLLQNLDLSNNSLGDEGAGFLSTALATLTLLQNLDLSRNSLGDRGVAVLSTALATLTLIQNLDISNNKVSAAGAANLSSVLAHLTLIQHLGLGDNVFAAEGTAVLARAVSNLTLLRNLILCGNGLGPEAVARFWSPETTPSRSSSFSGSSRALGLQGGSANVFPRRVNSAPFFSGSESGINLSLALAKLTLLQRLDMGSNDLGLQGAVALAPAVSHLANLKELLLHNNSLGGEGLGALAPVLANLTLLQSLDLSYNALGYHAAAALALVLSRLDNLQDLLLHHNKLGEQEGAALFPVLHTLTSLKALDLRSNCLGEVGWLRVLRSIQAIPLVQLNGVADFGPRVASGDWALTWSGHPHSTVFMAGSMYGCDSKLCGDCYSREAKASGPRYGCDFGCTFDICPACAETV